MGTIMIFLRMRRPGADGARREPARMGRRRASRRRVDVGRDVRRRDRAVRVVLDAMLAAQERARDLAINIVVEAALRRRRRRRGPVAARHVRRDLLQQTQAAVRECVEGPGPEEPRRLQFFRPLDSGGARRVVLAQRREDGGAGDGRARAHEAQIAARRARVRAALASTLLLAAPSYNSTKSPTNVSMAGGWRRHRRTQSSSSSTSLMSSRVKTPSVSWHRSDVVSGRCSSTFVARKRQPTLTSWKLRGVQDFWER